MVLIFVAAVLVTVVFKTTLFDSFHDDANKYFFEALSNEKVGKNTET